MTILSAIIDLLVPHAHAVVLNNVSSNPAVQTMWTVICSVMPFCNLGLMAPVAIAAKVSTFVFMMIGGIAVLVLIWAGIQIIYSGGNDEQIGEAKKIAQYAVIGLIGAIIGYSFVPYFVTVVIPQLFGA